MLSKYSPSSKFFLALIAIFVLASCAVDSESPTDAVILDFKGTISATSPNKKLKKMRFHWQSFSDHSVLSFSNSAHMIVARVIINPEETILKTINDQSTFHDLDDLAHTLLHRDFPLTFLFDSLTSGTLKTTQIDQVSIIPKNIQDDHPTQIALIAPDAQALVTISHWSKKS